MKPHIALVRALTAEFLRRKLHGLMITGAIVGAVALVIALWLTTINAWWWLLATIVIVLIILGIGAAITARLLIRLAAPDLTKQQAKATEEFVDKLEHVQGVVQTPAFIIVFRLVRDMLWPRPTTYVRSVIDETSSLKPDFADLQRQFH